MPVWDRVWRGARRWGTALAFSLAASAGAAQPVAAPDPEYDALFMQVLRNPADLDLSFKFAEVATRRGDYEAAIGTLERMLFYNPNLSRVKLELGVLYFRLGSYEMARSYLEEAVSAPDAPPDIRARVDGFIAEIERRTKVAQWSGFAQAGFRYQTNANAGPSSQIVRAAGVDAMLDRTFVRKPDWNAFALTGIRHIYDFQNQRGDVWETNFAGYYAQQFRFDRLDLGLAEIQTGPRLAVAPDWWPGLSIRPYGLANNVSLADRQYLTTLGGGVAMFVPVNSHLILEPFVEGRDRRFASSPDYPLARQQSGTLWTAGLFAQGELLWGPALRWQARFAYNRNDARAFYGFNGYDQIAVDIGFPIEFPGLWGGRNWAFVPTAGFARYDYDQPNPIVDPLVRRRDNEWRVGALFDIPVIEAAGFAVQVQYSKVDSNLPNYDTKNFSVSFGPTLRF